jgi:CBS-domain-containing membrane protein
MAQSVIDLFQQLARNEFGFFERLQTVSEIMSTTVPTVSSEVSVGEMIGRRDPLALGSMAVIDAAKGDVIGLLKHTTILRCLPRYVNTLKECDRDRSILTVNVCDLTTRKSPHVSPSASPLEVLEIMVQKNCDSVLVYDDPHELRGIITPVSFASAMLLYYRVFQTLQPLQRLRLIDLDSDLSLDEIFCRGAQTARDVMSQSVTVPGREPVATAIKLMQECAVSHLPILDEKNQVTGVVTRNDILMALQPPSRPGLLDHSVDLPPLIDLLASGLEPVLSEPISSVAKGRLISVSPTSRLADVLTRLAENGRDIVVVQDDSQIQGTISLTDIIRVFRTLMRLQSLKTM